MTVAGPDPDPGGRHEQAERPTVDKPLNGPRRPRLVPALLLLAFVAALVLFYLFGLEVLVPAD